MEGEWPGLPPPRGRPLPTCGPAPPAAPESGSWAPWQRLPAASEGAGASPLLPQGAPGSGVREPADVLRAKHGGTAAPRGPRSAKGLLGKVALTIASAGGKRFRGARRRAERRRRAGHAGKGGPARAAEDGGTASAAGPSAAAPGAPAAADDGPGGALGGRGAAGRGGCASSGRGAGALGHAGGRAGAGLRPGAALPPPAAAAEGEPAELDEGGCPELRPEHQYRQRAENQRSSSAESRQKPGGILRLVRPARTLSAPGLRVPFPELRQRQALAHSGAHGHQARRGPGREPALYPVPQHDQVPDLLCQRHPQRPSGMLQQDHGQDALAGNPVICRPCLDSGLWTEEPSGLQEAEAELRVSVLPSAHLHLFFQPHPVRCSSFR